MAWTLFKDRHSGGRTKIDPYQYIYIEANKEKAVQVFRERFDRDPENVTCDCCGIDYSIYEEENLAELTGFYRGCELRDGKYIEFVGEDSDMYTPLEEYLKRSDVLFIYAAQIEK